MCVKISHKFTVVLLKMKFLIGNCCNQRNIWWHQILVERIEACTHIRTRKSCRLIHLNIVIARPARDDQRHSWDRENWIWGCTQYSTWTNGHKRAIDTFTFSGQQCRWRLRGTLFKRNRREFLFSFVSMNIIYPSLCLRNEETMKIVVSRKGSIIQKAHGPDFLSFKSIIFIECYAN